MKRKYIGLLSIVITSLLGLLCPNNLVADQGDIVNCSIPFNISNSDSYLSLDPFLLNDPAGRVHLFWGEKLPGTSGQIPDTIMYAVWDGETWSEPNDIFLSPQEYVNRRIQSQRAVLDDNGIIHLMWTGPDDTLYYSSANADKANVASAWRDPIQLADDHEGSQYGFDLVYEPPQTVHVVFSRGKDQRNFIRSIAYVRSDDGGYSWSAPIDLRMIPDTKRGASNVRVLRNESNIYATWTEWDETGNGQAIYFIRSLDSGNSWDYPVLLDRTNEGDYERDWTNPMILGEDQLIVMWEGGYRAYAQAQYSDDNGATWSDPIDTFPWLIADNGFASMLWDNSGQLHAFLVRRIREGSGDVCVFPGCNFDGEEGTNTLWHSIWEGDQQWREPQPVGNFGATIGSGTYQSIGINFSPVAFVNGNQFVTAWFGFNEGEIYVMHCDLEGVSSVTPQPWPTQIPSPITEIQPTASPVSDSTSIMQESKQNVSLDSALPPSSDISYNPGYPIWAGFLSSLLIIVIVIIIKQLRNN